MKNEVIDKISALATAAFGLVAALAWNGAIQAIFAKYYGKGEGISAMLIYAIVVTLVAVIVTLIIGRIAERTKRVNLKENIRLDKLNGIGLRRRKQE